MFGLLRAGLLAFAILTAVYLLVSLYSRSVRREKLEKAWDSDPDKITAGAADREAYIRAGMETYRHGLRRKLIWLVYIIPMVVVLATVYGVNVQ